MKRKVLVLLILLSSMMSVWSQTTRYVPTGSGSPDYATIHDAINASVDGDIIIIAAGDYTESPISLNKVVTLQGPNAGIAGTGTRGAEARIVNTAITITVAAIIDGMEIYQTNNTADAIGIQAAATVKNSVIQRYGITTGNVARGITTSYVSGFNIEDNLFTGDLSGGLFGGHKTWNTGIWINGGSGTISGNTLQNCRTALNLDDFNNGISISGNTIQNCGSFISFGGTTPTNGQYVLGANSFNTLVSTFINLSNVNAAFRLDITSSTYGGVSFSSMSLNDLFIIESTMYHRGRGGNKLGLVYYVADNIYVHSTNPSISTAVSYAAADDIINVAAGTYTESTQININKASLTIQGMGSSNTVVQVSGTGYIFHVTQNGVTLKDLTIEKTDELGVQNIIYVGGDNFSLLNCTIFGQWDFEEGPVVRAMEVTYGITGMLIDNNIFHNLRQPAYINGSLASPTTGTISNNVTYETKGWVIDGGNMTFTGNIWENGTTYNVYDIAILSATPASYYTDIVAVSAANNDAVIEDQRVSPAVLSVVYVDASTSFGTDLGGRYHPYATINPAVTRVVSNGKINVAAGTYTEQLYINKEGLVIDGAGEDLTTVKSPATLTLSFATPGVKKPVVFIENVATCTLSNLTIDGDGKGNANNSFVGVGFWNAGGTLNNVDVIGVRDTPFSGAQHGVGVYAYNNIPDSYAINITDVDVSDFQKNAFALSGDGLTVTMDGVYVTGAGSTSVTAQNGIQIGFGASGTVANSTVTGIHYVDNVPPVDWTATAILLYAAGTVDISSTDVTNSQTNVYFIDASGSFNSSSVTSPVDDIWANGVDIYSSAAKSNSSQDLKNAIRPFMEEHQQQSARATISVSIVNSTLTGIDYAGNYGVGAYAEGTVNMTVTNSAITGWDYAISAYEDGGAVNGVAHENDLSDNTFGYDYNGTTWQDAENNWWGHASGPLDDSDADGLENLLGNGSAVSDFVDYDPWYADEDMTFNATTEETQVYNEDQGVYYNSIQDAILGADIGDVVEVTGTHNVKNIVVNKGLKIAAGAGGAKFNGLTGSRDGTGMVINTTEDVELDGVTFENYDVAIDFEAFGSAIISNCKFINCVAAINNQTTTEIDAENNYWGHATGPMDDSPLGLYNPYGQGGIVTDYIDYQPWFTSEGLDVMPVDIAIYNPECAHLEVRVRPNIDMNGQLTTALFAVKWTDASYPDPSALINVTSGYDIDFQYYDIDGGSRYAVFGLQTNALVDWTAGNEYVIVEFDLEQDQPEGTISDFEIANDAWAYAENALYYMEFWGSDYTGYVYGSADEVYTGDCDLQLHTKVLLQGPYNTISNEMKTDLNTFIPLNQPFNVAPWNYTGTESLASIPTDMVDWVMVELRSATTTTAVRKAALLFKDGSVRSHIDSFFDVYFTDDFMPNSDYYVVITARNHMPVMSAGLVNIPNANDEYDFTDMTNYPSYGGTTAQVLLEADVHGMISGDVNKDGELIYSGTDNDRDPILAKIVDVTTQPYINGVIQGYYQEDLTMNSWVKYSGSGNDQRLIILNLIELTGTYNLNAQYASLVPGTPVKATHVNAGTGAIDIALVEKENTLEVALITKADFEYSYATNIQFTLSWNANNPMMDAITESFVSDYKLEPQGAVIETNGRKYMTFVMVEAINLPSAFNIGDHATVLSFDKGIWAGTSSKSSIANDEYTRVNNGDYYISIVGLDQTGQALDVVTGISNPVSVSGTLQLYPNPATQGFVTLSLMPAVDETLTIMVMDLSSRIVSTQQIEVSKGLPVVKQINLDGLSKGLYFITLKGNETQKTAKVEIQ